MPDMDLHRSRRARSDISLLHLTTEALDWLKTCKKADARRQHATQLAAIESLILKLLARLREDFDALPKNGSVHGLYDVAARLDRRIVWVNRVWDFFRAKFDQRNDEDLKPALLAADEVVWSCYSPVFAKARARGLPIAPATAPPLPFVEARYSPEAFPAELVSSELKGEVEIEFLREHLNRMPISVVRIPPSCVSAPWWLVLLGHEVGHHVQYDLLPGKALVDAFREVIRDAAKKATNSTPESERWGNWSREIFADLFSVMCMGSLAVRAMLELEVTASAVMHDPRDRYPSPITRLQLLARAADRVTNSLSGSRVLALIPEADTSNEIVETVLDAALGKLPTLGVTLLDLCDFDADTFRNDVDSWCGSFRSSSERIPESGPRVARILVSSAFQAWDATVMVDDGVVLDAARSKLSARCTTAIINGAPDGERGGGEGELDGGAIDALVDNIWQKAN